MKKILFFLSVTMWFSGTFFTDSLYQNIPSRTSLFSDKQPKRLGDIITVLVVEQSQAKGQAETKVSKDNAVSGGPGAGVLDFAPSWGLSAKEKSEGKGVTNRSTFFSAKISVRITDILPEGNLRIEGGQFLTINNEKQNINISGIVRPEDISHNNTVYSYQIADAQITYSGKGSVSRKQKEGVLNKILGLIF